MCIRDRPYVISFFKQKTAYEISECLVGSEMCIRDRLEAVYRVSTHVGLTEPGFINVVPIEPL